MEFLRRWIKPRYVAALEEEVQRLRGENRALLNSLLGTAGFPPVEFPVAPVMRELPRARRRSWQQIQAIKEAEARQEAAAKR
ncbi:MAG TPA: hypothetical protein VMT51_16270 [Dongiaceae bacterium]|nr:hypothetical protein [Dongiaceae bacterium]